MLPVVPDTGLLDGVCESTDNGRLLANSLLEVPITGLEAAAAETVTEEVILVASSDDVTDKSVLFEGKTDDVEAEVGLEETLELDAKVVLEDTVDELEVPVRSMDELNVVADAVIELGTEVVATEDVVRLARRLEAEADDELGAAVETPTLSALMISAACKWDQYWLGLRIGTN